MEFIGILFALLFATILTAFFNLAFKNTGPWSGFWVFFILLFFIALAAGEWAAPRGPSAWGYYWAPGLIAALIFALILAAVTPRAPHSASRKPKKPASSGDLQTPGDEREEDIVISAIMGVFFWILISVLVLIAIVGVATKIL
ncbi:hypothetical protein SAMN05421820_107131 [Pedobacter steynii]|uniref:Uncharacterized protein n=1 Tax=Pedobacter steynii TaxID=430522 RepID=A0A1H0AKT3_9SPHI|nr:hypothetical protein [Pedobacter steynii]NQX41327.1 hypothetical protein [Pedobacter steynii]SDN34168.1 hypothetical protein SAMN05421820_107131 [Pedobacter steynii]